MSRPGPKRRIALAVMFVSATTGCASSTRDHRWLRHGLQSRLGLGGAALAPSEPGPFDPGPELDEHEVVARALARNPGLRAALTGIDRAHADLTEANRPANPQLSLSGPVGPLSAVALLVAPIESLWQLPSRAEAAALAADVAGEQALAAALEAARTALALHAALGLAQARVRLRVELAQVAGDFARVAEVRARLGEVSPLDERLFAAEAQVAADALAQAHTEAAQALARLAAHLAWHPEGSGPTVVFGAPLVPPSLPMALGAARRLRPEIRAAELAVRAAARRVNWETARGLSVAALVEGHWAQPEGPGLRLGARVELPLFGANPGGVGRAEAEVLRALAEHEAAVLQTRLEVALAHTRALQAAASRARFEGEVLGALETALALATHSFQEGEETWLVVLDVLRRTGEARLRQAELVAEQRQALADLARAVGAGLDRASNLAEPSATEEMP